MKRKKNGARARTHTHTHSKHKRKTAAAPRRCCFPHVSTGSPHPPLNSFVAQTTISHERPQQQQHLLQQQQQIKQSTSNVRFSRRKKLTQWTLRYFTSINSILYIAPYCDGRVATFSLVRSRAFADCFQEILSSRWLIEISLYVLHIRLHVFPLVKRTQSQVLQTHKAVQPHKSL